MSLARELGVDFTSFIVITDDQGYIIYKSRGFIDSELARAAGAARRPS